MKLSELAQTLALEFRGDGGVVVDRVATIQSAGEGELCFLANDRYRPFLKSTGASVVVVHPDLADECRAGLLLSQNPYADYARAAALLHPSRLPGEGVHPSAVVHESATLAGTAHVGPGAVIEADARLEEGVSVAAGAFVGQGVAVGAGTRVGERVVLGQGTRLGRDCLIHPGVVVGADGFGFARDGAEWVKVPQLGGVRIGDRVEIGANTTVDRGAIEDTVIEDDVKLDNQIQVAHNVHIGAGTAIAGCTAIAGSSEIGRNCMIAGGVGIAGHLKITDEVVITAMTLVSRSILKPGVYSGSLPMDDSGSWRKNSARFRKLDEMARRLNRLERADDNKSGETDQ